MFRFAILPQALLLCLVASPITHASFNSSYIRTLSFNGGDLICGFYRIAMRTAPKAEFSMSLTPSNIENDVSGWKTGYQYSGVRGTAFLILRL